MEKADFIERVLRVDPDVIYTSPFVRTVTTAKRVQEILKLYRNKEVEIIQEE
jgi:phosphohistidine phosphatase SixA